MIAAGVITYGLRLFFILIVGDREISAEIKTGLFFVPPTVLTAIILPEILYSGDELQLNIGNYRLLASLFAVLIAWKTKSPILTVAIGMILLWVLQMVST
jgi:branched-subunit amino acid transport protein